jgi:hypothetical protein
VHSFDRSAVQGKAAGMKAVVNLQGRSRRSRLDDGTG